MNISGAPEKEEDEEVPLTQPPAAYHRQRLGHRLASPTQPAEAPERPGVSSPYFCLFILTETREEMHAILILLLLHL